MKTKLYKAVLLAALGLGGLTAAQAQDALLGFNDASGTANDYVIDLGSGSQFTTTATLNFSFSTTTFNSAFSADSMYLNNVAAGFVSQVGSSSILQSYAGGTPAGLQPSGTPDANNVLLARGAASGILLDVNASSSGATAQGNAWSYNIAQSPTSTGLAGAQALAGVTGNPMGTLTAGVITLPVFESTIGSGRNAPASAWTEVGTLAVDATAGTAIFNGVAVVPEPTTYSLLGGAALLLVSFRKKFSRKQA